MDTCSQEVTSLFDFAISLCLSGARSAVTSVIIAFTCRLLAGRSLGLRVWLKLGMQGLVLPALRVESTYSAVLVIFCSTVCVCRHICEPVRLFSHRMNPLVMWRHRHVPLSFLRSMLRHMVIHFRSICSPVSLQKQCCAGHISDS